MKSSVLLKNLLLSTSYINAIRHESDKKKQKKIRGKLIGMVVAFVTLMIFFVSIALDYGASGMTEQIPVFTGVILVFMEFMFTLLKANGYLFGFKDYDTLMSLPFTVKQVVSCKFLYMYIKNLPYVVLISVSMMIGYGVFAKATVGFYLLWSVLSLLLPVIPMVLASFIGSFIAGVSSGFKHKNVIQIVLTMIFVLFCFSLRFIIDSVVANNEVEEMVQNVTVFTDAVKKYYIPVAWFENSVLHYNVKDIVLFVVVSVAVYEAAFFVVSKFYRQINSSLMSGSAKRRFKAGQIKSRSVVNSIAYKESRRFVSSTNYFVNIGMGVVLTVIVCLVAIVFGMDKIIAVVTQGAPVSTEMLLPAIPMVVFFLVGMCSSTSVSPSLEGKNLWLVQSLPISTMDYYRGKMRFNMYLILPFAVLGNIVLGISCGGSLLNILLFCVLGLVHSVYCTTWGMVCGLKFIKTEWENEMEVIKQGSAVAVYLLPNMFISMGLCVFAVVLGVQNVNCNVITLILILLYSIPATISYLRVKSMARKGIC